MKYISSRTQCILNGIKREGINSNKQNFDSDNVRDLIQQAELLALDAVDRFNGDVNNEIFYKYARKYILGGLTAFVLNQGDISIPAASRYEYNRILSIRDEMEKSGNKVSARRLAEASSTSIRTVLTALRTELLLAPAQRLDITIDNDKADRPTALVDLIPQDSIAMAEEEILGRETTETVRMAVMALPLIERKVIRLAMEGRKTAEIAKATGIPEYAVTKVRISALRRLRGNEQLKKLKESLQAA